MSKTSRRKGHDWERQLAKLFAAAMPGADVKRGIGQVRAGDEVADVDCPLFWVEAKVGIKPNPRAALDQAIEACPLHKYPLAVVKDSVPRGQRQGPGNPFVVMPLYDFLDFVHRFWALGGKLTK